MMKQLQKGLKAVAIVLLVAIVAVVAINAFDDKLDPKAAAAGVPRPPRVPDAQNGYFALLALGADDGADGMAYATAWLNEARAAARESRAEKRVPAKRVKLAERPELCDPLRTSCLITVKDKVSESEAALDAWKEDLTRYEKLIASTAYEEVLDYPLRAESSLPSYVNVGTSQRAYLLRAALAAQSGRIEQAIEQLEKDVAFQRVMLDGSRTLIGRMIAASNYSRDLAFITDLLQTSTADLKPLAPRVSAMLKPLPAATFALDAVFDTEFGGAKHTLTHLVSFEETPFDSALGWLGKHTMYKPNKTINMVYREYEAAGNLSKLNATQLLAESTVPAISAEMTWWDYIDNPIGNILTRIATPSFRGYALRLRDLDAHHRLLALAAEIYAQDVVTDNVAEFVTKSEARFFDPYTGKPMAWDAVSKRLSFKRGQAGNNRATFNVEKGVVFVTL